LFVPVALILLFIGFLLIIFRQQLIEILYKTNQNQKDEDIYQVLDHNFESVTALNSVKKAIDLTKNLYMSILKNSYKFLNKSLYGKYGTKNNIPRTNDLPYNQIEIQNSNIYDRESLNLTLPDYQYNKVEEKSSNDDPGYSFFHKYSINEVRNKIDNLLKSNNRNNLETKNEDYDK
jgi:hypothetical protein